MASYNELNALIDAYINRNGIQAITGQILNGVLKAMVEQLGRGYTIMGAATPTTDPGTPDGPECYFASETGTYTDFDGLQVVPGELALLCYTPTDGWTKATIYEGFQEVEATIDGNVGTPSVGVSYANGVLSFDFHNMKGNPGDAAGFGTIGADIAGGVGTPGVSVESSGPATAKNLQFHFSNLKGETGVTSVVATVDNTTGTPACTVSLVGQQLTLAFSGLKGAQGDTGSSVDYPFTIVNNLTTDDATQALSAAQGVVLAGEVSQLRHEVDVVVATESYTSPNLFDKTAATSGKGIWRADGSADSKSGSYASDFIPIPADATYMTLVRLEISGGFGAAIYNSSKQWRSGVTTSTFAVNPSDGDAYFRFTIKSSNLDSAMAVVGNTAPSEYVPFGTLTKYVVKDSIIGTDEIQDGAVTGEKLADGSISGDKLSDNSVTSEKLDSDAVLGGISGPEQKYVGYNLLDASKSQKGYINKNSGAFVADPEEHLYATDFIPVDGKNVFAYPYSAYGASGGAAVYDANKAYLRITGRTYTYQNGDAFVRFTYKDNNSYQIVCYYPAPTISGLFSPSYIEQDITPFAGDQVFGADNIPVAKPAIASVGQDGMQVSIPSLSGNYSELTGWPSYIKNGQTVSVRAKFSTVGEVRCGFNRGDNSGYFIRIDSAKVYVCKYTTGGIQELVSENHGLTLADFVDMYFTMKPDRYKVCVCTSDGIHTMSGEFETKRENYGIPFVEAVGTTALTDISLRAISDRFRKPVWVIGDSYVSLYQQRWPYQLIFGFGFEEFLLDGLAGGTSTGMFSELQKLLSLGCPKFLLWCFGMNDTSWKWRNIEKQVEMLCRERGIELILTTIPWPTGGSKADINQCVKESGYRYIDVYDAVSSDENGTWYSGMNDDGTHPTILGAQAIAAQVLADFPEITQ